MKLYRNFIKTVKTYLFFQLEEKPELVNRYFLKRNVVASKKIPSKGQS